MGVPVQVFTPYSMSVYLRLFNHLWRAKHMEYVTTAAWKQQTMNRKLWTRDVPGRSGARCKMLFGGGHGGW